MYAFLHLGLFQAGNLQREKCVVDFICLNSASLPPSYVSFLTPPGIWGRGRGGGANRGSPENLKERKGGMDKKGNGGGGKQW